MPADGEKMCEAYRYVDAARAAKGSPATSLAWLTALESFWRSGATRMVVRKGRQVGASTIICPNVAVTTCEFGDFTFRRGTRITIGLTSTRQKEADERLYNIEHAFHDIGVRVKVRGDTIEHPKKSIVIQSFPATSDASRGANAGAFWMDEMPAWRDGDGANPAEERDAAIVPAGVTHPNFRIYSVGTPLGFADFHARLVDLGDTPQQRVFVGPSWHWNPTLSPERCRELAGSDRLFRREFEAIPQGTETAVFDIEDIDHAMRPWELAS